MKPLPTAEEFLDNYIEKENIPWSQDIDKYYGAVNTAMIEFAKLHVEAALRAASEKAQLKYFTDAWGDPATMIDRKTILNAYPLEKIK